MYRATLGNVVRIGPASAPILVRDTTGALVDPATITITFQRPDGTTTVPATPQRDALGTYHYDYEPLATLAMAGKHPYKIVTTNPDAEYAGTLFFEAPPFF